jgi:uncharacterized protein HemX
MPPSSPFADIRTLGAVLGMAVALFSGYLSTVKSGDAARSADNAEEAAKYVTQEKGNLFREMMEAMKRRQEEGHHLIEEAKKRDEASEKRADALQKRVEALEAKAR